MAEIDLTTKLKSFPKIKSISATPENAVLIKWSKVALAEKYDIKRSESPNGEFKHIEWSKKPEFLDETVEKNITYWYKVIAWKRMEGKKTSTKASALKPVVVSDIPSVEDLKATSDDGKITLTWKKDNNDKFFVYRRSDNFTRPILIGETKNNSFTDTNPVSGQAYHYSVQGVKISDSAELHGNFSNEVDSVFLDSAQILSIKASFSKKVYANARIVAGCDGYILERSENKNGDFQQVLRTDDITAVFFEDKLPSRFKTYYYRVCAYKNIGEKEFYGKYSDVISL